jgi:hypothetical protein
MQVLTFVWVPTLLDSLVPFAFLACELFMAHFVFNNLRSWLLTLGLMFVAGGAAQILTVTLYSLDVHTNGRTCQWSQNSKHVEFFDPMYPGWIFPTRRQSFNWILAHLQQDH